MLFVLFACIIPYMVNQDNFYYRPHDDGGETSKLMLWLLWLVQIVVKMKVKLQKSSILVQVFAMFLKWKCVIMARIWSSVYTHRQTRWRQQQRHMAMEMPVALHARYLMAWSKTKIKNKITKKKKNNRLNQNCSHCHLWAFRSDKVAVYKWKLVLIIMGRKPKGLVSSNNWFAGLYSTTYWNNITSVRYFYNFL